MGGSGPRGVAPKTGFARAHSAPRGRRGGGMGGGGFGHGGFGSWWVPPKAGLPPRASRREWWGGGAGGRSPPAYEDVAARRDTCASGAAVHDHEVGDHAGHEAGGQQQE